MYTTPDRVYYEARLADELGAFRQAVVGFCHEHTFDGKDPSEVIDQILKRHDRIRWPSMRQCQEMAEREPVHLIEARS